MIAHIHDVHGTIIFIHCHSTRKIELAVGIAEAAPGHDKLAGPVEFLDTEIRAVYDIHIAALIIYSNAPRRIELSIPASLATPFGQVGSGFRVEALNTLIAGIAAIDHYLIVNSNALWRMKCLLHGYEQQTTL